VSLHFRSLAVEDAVYYIKFLVFISGQSLEKNLDGGWGLFEYASGSLVLYIVGNFKAMNYCGDVTCDTWRAFFDKFDFIYSSRFA
jgi:hypothetical protein